MTDEPWTPYHNTKLYIHKHALFQNIRGVPLEDN